ncbi:hypothetical protein ACROYT_G012008 [Oculina patagonica]
MMSGYTKAEDRLELNSRVTQIASQNSKRIYVHKGLFCSSPPIVDRGAFSTTEYRPGEIDHVHSAFSSQFSATSANYLKTSKQDHGYTQSELIFEFTSRKQEEGEMKCVYCWSAILLSAFLVGTISGEEVIVSRQNQKASKTQESIALPRIKRSRRSHDENGDTAPSETTLGSAVLKAKPVMFTEVFNDTEEDLIDLNYETLWRNGTETLTRVAIRDLADFSETNGSNPYHVVDSAVDEPEPELLSHSQRTSYDSLQLLSRVEPPLKSRLKRLIFGRDGRIRLNTSTQAQKFPFSASVKISTGCTGSLISNLHVLTSAHCIHNGQQLLMDIAKLKVGFLRRNGKLRWVGVDNVKFPQNWRLESTPPSFDYAVITLHRAQKRPFFKLGVIRGPRRQYKLHFASFPGDKKPNSLWYNHCESRVVKNLLICRCDTVQGSSGAGTYVRTQHLEKGKDRVVVGILSGSGSIRMPNGESKLFNLVTKLTNLKARQICRWIGAGSDCISWSSRSVDRYARLRSVPRG